MNVGMVCIGPDFSFHGYQPLVKILCNRHAFRVHVTPLTDINQHLGQPGLGLPFGSVDGLCPLPATAGLWISGQLNPDQPYTFTALCNVSPHDSLSFFQGRSDVFLLKKKQPLSGGQVGSAEQFDR
jgi:hypothetical protein